MQNDSLKGLVGWSGGQKKSGHISAFKLFDRSQNFKKKDKKGGGGHSIVKKCSIYLIDTMKRCNQEFKFDQSLIPRRFLTVPNEGVSNNNYDNEQSDYIMRVKDIIYNDQRKIEYIIEDMLGKGTFGQVAKCSKNGTNDLFAVKVIKNRPAYFQQAKNEILLLRVLNKQEEQNGENYQKRIVNLVDFFVFRNHFCLVFEMLELSLYDYLKNTKFCGFSFSVIAQWTKSILEGMVIAESKQIIHCDLKPENIMLKNNQLKIIDFGSACHQDKRIFTYIQSRFYRAPEVILGMIYTTAIDMWSLGCILVELFLGLPIFPGNSEYDQIKRIIDILGKPTNEVIEQGRFKNKFFKCLDGEYVFKTKQEFEMSEGIQLKESKTYFQVACLNDLKNYMYNSQFRRNEDDSKNNRQFDLFLDLATQLLELNPRKRVKASIAMLHPFLNQDENNFYSSLTNQKIDNTREFSLDQSTSDERHHDINKNQQQNSQNTDFNLFKVSDQNAAIVNQAIQKQKENQEKLKQNQLTSDPQQQQMTNFLPGQQQIGSEQNMQQQHQYINQYPLQQQQGQFSNDQYNFPLQQAGIQQNPFNQPFAQQPQTYNTYLNQNMYQYPFQYQQQTYPQQIPQMLPQQQQPIQQQAFPYQLPYNQAQQQQQVSTDQLANLFNQQLNLQTSYQFQNQKQSFRNQKQTKKCLSQQDSLDYQKEFYDDCQNQFSNNQISDKNMWSVNQNQIYKNNSYNYQYTGANQGFQQGISNIENNQDQQAPPENIKDIFEQQPQQMIRSQNYQQGNQQMQQGFLLNQQYLQNFQNFYNPQQQLGVNSGNFQPNNNLLGAQFQVQDQPQQQNQQQYQIFQQQFNQQNYGFNQFNNQQNTRQNYQLFNQNQNNLQQNLFLQHQQYYQQQQHQQQMQQQPLNQQNSQIPSQSNQQQNYYNKPYQNQKQNNKYKNSTNGKNSNNNTRQADNNYNNNFNNSNNNNNNNSQKNYQNNKKFRRHYSDSEFQQYQPEQNEIFNDIKAPFIEPDQIENQSQNFGKSGDNLQEDNKQERHGDDSTSNNSSNYSNNNNNNSNNAGNQKQIQNYKRQNSNYSNNQNYSNQKNQQKFKKANQGSTQQQQNCTFNSNSNNNNYSQNFPNQNTQFQANASNNSNNISSSSSSNNNNNNSILNNNSSNQVQIQTQNMKTNQQNNNNSNNSNDQQNQHNSQDNNSNFKKGQNKFKNQNKKNYANQKYQQQNAQQQQFQQGQKQYSPINESPSQS
ncbi:hypothetical protein ABPG74_006386 [Tetrahymena malaccensis]